MKLLYYDRRVLLIYKAFWERNIEDSATETSSYLFLYYDISVEFYHLSSPQLFKYLRIYPGKEGSIVYFITHYLAFQFKRRKKKTNLSMTSFTLNPIVSLLK